MIMMNNSNNIPDDRLYEDFEIDSSSEITHPTTSYSKPRLATANRNDNRRIQTSTISNGLEINRSPTTARPLTSKQGAGFGRPGTRSGLMSGTNFDPLSQASKSSKAEQKPEEKRKEMESKIYSLIDQSYEAYSTKNYTLALDLAKEASKKEKSMLKDMESYYPNSQPNPDLSFCVLFALGNMYHVNKFYQEAMNTYQCIVRDKQYQMSERLRVCMGNVYKDQGQFTQAIKMFQMALDSIPNTFSNLRYYSLTTLGVDGRTKISMNIADCYLKMNQIQDALQYFLTISETNPSHVVLYNLIICYYGLSDADKMRKYFQKLVMLDLPVYDAFLQNDEDDEVQAIYQDDLREFAKKKIHEIECQVLNVARLISPVIESSFEAGFDWTIEQVKNSTFAKVSADIEVAKALYLVKIQKFDKAIELLKEFEKNTSNKVSAAATNLSALMLGKGDLEKASKYAEEAVKTNRFNSKASNNLAVCSLMQNNLGKAMEILNDSLAVDSLLIETLFNIGLSLKKSENNVEALRYFEKLNEMIPQDSEVVFHIADCHDRLDNQKQAIEWFSRALSIIPTDPDILMIVGKMYARMGDKTQAFHYYSEGFRYYPDNLDLLTWLGGYYVENEMYEVAMQTFHRASIIQPREPKWQLMVASCMRRSGNYQQALARYKKIHEIFPDSVDCLRFLSRLCNDMGVPEAQEYADKLNAMERKDRGILVSPTLLGSIDDAARSLSNELSPVTKQSISDELVRQPTVFVQQEKINWNEANVDVILPD